MRNRGLPPSLRDWLAEDHLAWFVLDAVDELDLSAFVAEYRQDGWGRAAFDPTMMVALLLYADAVGERSSRAIERRCLRGCGIQGDQRQSGARPRHDRPVPGAP
jgi:transposase